MDKKHCNSHPDQAVRSSIRALLRPVVRFCLQRTILAQELVQILNQALIDEAKNLLTKQGEDVNVSRLAVLTGLPRQKIRKADTAPTEKSKDINLLARIIGQWSSHPDYLDSNNKPRTLEISGENSEFFELVQSVTADVSPYTALFGLEKSGAVEKSGNQVKLKAQDYRVSEDVAEGLAMLAEDSNDLLKSVEENLFEAPKIPNLHLTTAFDNIVVDDVPEIRNWVLDEGAKFHARAREFLSSRDLDSNPRLYAKKGGSRVVLSSFSFTEKPKE